MNIEWIIPCRYVEVHDNLGTIIGAGIDTLWVPQLPAPVQLMMAIRLVGLDEELSAGVSHKIANRIRNPAGAVLGEMADEMTIEAQATRPEWLVGLIVPTVVAFEAATEGTYTFEFEIDQASHALPFHVAEGAPNAET